MEITPTDLRKDLYRLLDRAIETGEVIYVKRGDRRVKIQVGASEDEAVEQSLKRLEGLESCIVGDPDDLPYVKAGEWTEPAKFDDVPGHACRPWRPASASRAPPPPPPWSRPPRSNSPGAATPSTA